MARSSSWGEVDVLCIWIAFSFALAGAGVKVSDSRMVLALKPKWIFVKRAGKTYSSGDIVSCIFRLASTPHYYAPLERRSLVRLVNIYEPLLLLRQNWVVAYWFWIIKPKTVHRTPYLASSQQKYLLRKFSCFCSERVDERFSNALRTLPRCRRVLNEIFCLRKWKQLN